VEIVRADQNNEGDQWIHALERILSALSSIFFTSYFGMPRFPFLQAAAGDLTLQCGTLSHQLTYLIFGKTITQIK